MASQPPTSRAANRDRGLEVVRSVTVAATLGGVGLTVAFAVIAAESFAGHNVAAAPADATQAVPVAPTAPPVNGDDSQPQPPPPNALGNGNQAPAVVSGGS